MLPSSLKSPGRNWPNLSVVAATHRSIVVEANDPKQIEKAAMKTCTDMLGGGLSPFARRQN